MKNINYYKIAPEVINHYLAIEKQLKESLTIEKSIFHLIKVRASELNGCAYCLNLHTTEALNDGENKERLFLINVFNETGDLFTEREKMALVITERVTLISEYGMDEDFLEDVLDVFTESEYIEILLIINQINAWNRLSIATLKPYK